MTRVCSNARVLGAVASLAMIVGGPAVAQIWIGQIAGEMAAQGIANQKEHACMTGTAMPDSEIQETRADTYATMSGYWGAVQGGRTANVSAFYHPDSKASWSSGGKTVSLAGLIRVSDPFATIGTALDSNPVSYLRAGDGRTVRGQWGVRQGDKRVGTYDAVFKRKGDAWRLYQLTLIAPTAYAEPLVQYCHVANDVLPYRLSWSDKVRIEAAKQAEKTRAKAAKVKIKADQAATTSIAKEASERAVRAEAKALAAVEAARKAIEVNEQAKADASAAAAARASAISALTTE